VNFRHELQQKTNKLAKESNDYIKQLSRLTQSSNPTEEVIESNFYNSFALIDKN
jgi:hypothetical protein